MTLSEDLEKEVKSVFATQWHIREGQKVPETEDIQLGNYGVNLTSTVLYADLAQSTALITANSREFAAEVYKAYLYCAAKVISAEGGTITAYDGDRIMAVFIGTAKNTSAARAALKINHAVSNIINPKLYEQYPRKKGTFEVRQAVGVDTSPLMVARTGIRGANDLVWVDRAANYGAKLCELRTENFASWITADVYNNMQDSVKTSSDGRLMWEARTWTRYGIRIYRSNWTWRA